MARIYVTQREVSKVADLLGDVADSSTEGVRHLLFAMAGLLADTVASLEPAEQEPATPTDEEALVLDLDADVTTGQRSADVLRQLFSPLYTVEHRDRRPRRSRYKIGSVRFAPERHDPPPGGTGSASPG